jgi:hypothetical protein
VALAEGDGEAITGIASYRDFLLVFKETKFFVFYGESIGPDGSTPEFNYREVPIPIGRRDGGHVAEGEDGVYFVVQDGTASRLYKTDGGKPIDVSDDLGNTYLQPDVWCRGRNIFVDASSDSLTLVYDTETAEWIARDTVSYEVEFLGDVYSVPYTGGDSGILMQMDSNLSTDYIAGDDIPIVPSYLTGYQQMSAAGAEGVIREVLLDGTGTVTAQINADGTAGTAVAVTPTASTIGRYRKTVRGRAFQLSLSSSSGTWNLSRVIANVQPSRPVGAS